MTSVIIVSAHPFVVLQLRHLVLLAEYAAVGLNDGQQRTHQEQPDQQGDENLDERESPLRRVEQEMWSSWRAPLGVHVKLW